MRGFLSRVSFLGESRRREELLCEMGVQAPAGSAAARAAPGVSLAETAAQNDLLKSVKIDCDESAASGMVSGLRGGEVAEWFKAHAWKACVANPYRGFKSLPLRQISFLEVSSCRWVVPAAFLRLSIRTSVSGVLLF